MEAYRVYGGADGEPIRMLGIQAARSEDEALRLFNEIVNSVSMLQAGLKPLRLAYAVLPGQKNSCESIDLAATG